MSVLAMNKQRKSRGRDAHQIVPLAWLVALWNSVKGGPDVVSRMLKNVKVDFLSLHPRAFFYWGDNGIASEFSSCLEDRANGDEGDQQGQDLSLFEEEVE